MLHPLRRLCLFAIASLQLTAFAQESSELDAQRNAAMESATAALRAGDRAKAEEALSPPGAAAREKAKTLATVFSAATPGWTSAEHSRARKLVLEAFGEAATTGSQPEREAALLDAGEFAWNVLRDAGEAENWVGIAKKMDPENPRYLYLRALLDAKRQRDRQLVKDVAELRRFYTSRSDSPSDTPAIPQPDIPPPVEGGTPTPPTLPGTSRN